MNLFLVICDLMIINCPILHWGHSARPFFGELVPKMIYFFFFAEYEIQPFESRYCVNSLSLKFNKFFHNNSRANYLESIKRDVKKREWLELNNFLIVEIEQNEVEKLSKKWFKKEFNIIL